MVVVDTGKGTLRGKLQQVKPDHIVLRQPEGKPTFFIRLQKVVWVMPD